MRTSARRGLGLLVAGLLALGALPMAAAPVATAETNGSMPSTNEQILYAYTDDGGTLDVSATFLAYDAVMGDSGWDSNLLAKAVIYVTDPAGVKTTYSKSFDGTSNVTVSQAGIASSDGNGGVWKVQITSLDSKGNTAELNGSEPARVVVDPWSVVPRQGGAAKTGRVWTESLNSFQPIKMSLDKKVDFTTWNLSSTGVLYKNTYRDFMGIVSSLTTDDLGIGDKNCNPTYQSWNYTTTTTTKRAQSCSSATRYRIFLATPDDTMPARARAWGNGSTWVYPSYQPADVTTPSLFQASTVYYSGTFSARAINQKGTMTFYVDADNNGSYTDPVDLQLDAGDVDAGATGTVVWDGKDGQGNLIDRRIQKNLGIRVVLSRVGEIHFVRQDVEVSAGGIEVEQLTGPEVGSKLLSWDDTHVGTKCLELDSDGTGWNSVTCTGAATNPKSADRVSSAGGVHGWDSSATNHQGGWGDSRYVDDWTSFGEAASQTAEVHEGELHSDLAITKTDGRNDVAPLDSLTYTLTVTNREPLFPEDNGTVIDYLPAGVTYVSSSSGGVYDSTARTVTWTGVQVAPSGGTATRRVTVTVDRDIARPAALTNYATVQGDPALGSPAPTSDPAADCSGDLCTSDTDQVPAADLSIGKDDAQTIVNRDQTLTWTLTASNGATVAEPEALITDILPGGVDFVSASNGGTWDAATRTVTWPRFSLGAGATTTRTVTAKVRLDMTRPGQIMNVAEIAPTNEEPPGLVDGECPASVRWCADDTDRTVAPDLKVSKTDDADLVEPGDQLTWKLTVRNDGQADETGVTVVDLLPTEVDFGSVSNGGVLDAATGRITWTGLAVPAGESIELTVKATVKADVARPAAFTNYASIAGPGDTPTDPGPGCTGPTCASDTDRTALADLRVVKTVTDSVLTDGGTVSWKLQVGNLSDEQRARGVVVRDWMPPEIDPASVVVSDATQGSWANNTWTVGDLQPGEQASITVTATIPITQGLAAEDVITNEVRATSIDDPSKGDPQAEICVDNDTLVTDTDGCDLVSLYPNTTLAIAKDDGITVARRGDTLTYQLVASNTGQVAEREAVIRDILPSELAFISASDGGTFDTSTRTISWEPAPIAAGASISRTVTVKVKADTAFLTEFTNIARISAGSVEPDAADGCIAPLCAADTDKVPADQIVTGIPGGINTLAIGTGLVLLVGAVAGGMWLVARHRRGRRFA